MKKRILKVTGAVALAVLGVAVFAQVWVSAQGNEANLTGSWDVTVTIRNCQSGAELFSFPAMITYHQGGTMEESDLGGPGIVRLEGHGVWRRQNERQYSAAYRWLNFNPDRTLVGTQVVRSSITLGPRGDSYTSTDSGQLVDANGNVVPGGCATTTAKRFE
jgi:hypothetical protein